MSGFLLFFDWIMQRVTRSERNGVRWNFNTVLEDLDFVDDIALISSKCVIYIENQIGWLMRRARTRLKLNVSKCEIMRMNARNDQKLKTNDEKVQDTDHFTYLGLGGGSDDIKYRLTKTWASFRKLNKIW
ncbi:hypothetical protein HOLleu_18237 [Holothuria leucospilota]|uniref:Reverse transcriptase domain-containing protein n=1 Tax=Holothuria leucospilota TaxID=206669 RepID=A0A9Q1C2J7_HOLLE|nr:hypothetical protein HOLleu_18237 [Holothuria leucospilota]